jgi:hypothetical protein
VTGVLQWWLVEDLRTPSRRARAPLTQPSTGNFLCQVGSLAFGPATKQQDELDALPQTFQRIGVKFTAKLTMATSLRGERGDQGAHGGAGLG